MSRLITGVQKFQKFNHRSTKDQVTLKVISKRNMFDHKAVDFSIEYIWLNKPYKFSDSPLLLLKLHL
jgi:hypothetical protein